MSTVNNARVVVSLRDRNVEIEGSEEFVANQLERLKSVISFITSMEQSAEPDRIEPKKLSRDSSSSLGKYAKLYVTQGDGKVDSLKQIPGGNMKHKTVSAALLLSFANTLMGAEETSLEEIRKTCKEHDCHDTNNFAATIKQEKTLFVHNESSTIRLSDAGRELAQNMADYMLSSAPIN